MDPLNVGKLNSFFGEGVVLKGKLKFKGILRLDGDLEGEVTSGETFIVGKSGKVRADIKTDNLFNFGGVVGNVIATNKISLHAESNLKGDINSPYLVAEEFSFFDGSCRMPLDKRKPIDKLGRGSITVPKPPTSIPTYAQQEGDSSPSSKKMAALIVVLALMIGWFTFGGGDIGWLTFGGGDEDVATDEATTQTAEGLADETVAAVDEPADTKQTAVVIEKKEEPKPVVEVVLSETDRLKKEIKDKPLDPQPWLKLVFNSLQENNYKGAILILEESVDALPKSSELRILIAKTYQKVGREKDAQKHFLTLAEIDSRSIEAKNNDGFKRLEKGGLRQAANIFSQILVEDPENHRARLGLATVYSRREENDKAAMECLRILEHTKDYAPAMNRLAWIYAKQGLKLKQAKALSERSIRIFSDIPEYLDTLSEINFRLGDYDKAIDLINRAIALAPNDSYYERQLFKFQRAKKRNS